MHYARAVEPTCPTATSAHWTACCSRSRVWIAGTPPVTEHHQRSHSSRWLLGRRFVVVVVAAASPPPLGCRAEGWALCSGMNAAIVGPMQVDSPRLPTTVVAYVQNLPQTETIHGTRVGIGEVDLDPDDGHPNHGRPNGALPFPHDDVGSIGIHRVRRRLFDIQANDPHQSQSTDEGNVKVSCLEVSVPRPAVFHRSNHQVNKGDLFLSTYRFRQNSLYIEIWTI